MPGKTKSTIFTVIVYLAVAGMLIVGYIETREKKEEPAPLPQAEIIVQGSIKPIGVNMKNVATHILTKDDGSVIVLNANGIDLDMYVNEKRVEVTGTIEKGASGKDVLRVTNVSGANEIVAPQDPKKIISEWKIYESAKLGIMAKYKSDWTTEEKDKILTFKIQTPVENNTAKVQPNVQPEPKPEPKFDTVTFEILPNTKGQTLDEYVAGLNDVTIQKSKIGLDSTAAYKRTLGGKVSYYAERESRYFYKISYVPDANKLYDPNRNLFYEVVGAMRFIPFGN